MTKNKIDVWIIVIGIIAINILIAYMLDSWHGMVGWAVATVASFLLYQQMNKEEIELTNG